jgi:hypothetical protein
MGPPATMTGSGPGSKLVAVFFAARPDLRSVLKRFGRRLFRRLLLHAEFAEELRSQRRYFGPSAQRDQAGTGTAFRRAAAQNARPNFSVQAGIFLCDLIFLSELCV